MRTLRSQLILSHILPLLILIPLFGIALIYVLETQVLLPNLSDELVQQANLLVDIAADYPGIWTNPAQAQAFVARFGAHHRARTMLIDPHARLLASSDPDMDEQADQPLNLPDLAPVLAGQPSAQLKYSQNLHTEIVDVLVPVFGPNGQVVGIIRLTHQLSSVFEQFLRLRYLIGGTLTVELLLGLVIGLVLALDIEYSLRQVTEAIYKLANGQQRISLPEKGPQEIRLLLRAFNTLTERLHDLEEGRQRLLANLVHELSRPMGALKSAVEALLKGGDNTPFRQELLEGMAAEIQRLYPLLDNLTELRGQALGSFELNCRPTPLGHWLAQTISPWRTVAQTKALSWQVTMPDSLPVLKIDPDRLAQALGNLLSNATKYTPENGSISILVNIAAEGIWIRVCDTGPGVAANEQERIFEPFYRSSASSYVSQGMGLGLTISRDLVVAHGGRLEVESNHEQGSCFSIWLPRLLIISDDAVAGGQVSSTNTKPKTGNLILIDP